MKKIEKTIYINDEHLRRLESNPIFSFPNKWMTEPISKEYPNKVKMTFEIETPEKEVKLTRSKVKDAFKKESYDTRHPGFRIILDTLFGKEQ